MRTHKQVMQTIAQIGKASAKLQTRIHECAVECLSHAFEHGNTSLVAALYDALPNGQRREALVEWVETFSPIVKVKNKEGQTVWKQLPDTAKKYKPYDLEAANATPYYDLVDERNGFKIDLGKLDFDTIVRTALASKVKRLEKAIALQADGKFTPEDGECPQERLNDLIADATRAGYMSVQAN